jgi:hypothetical protein
LSSLTVFIAPQSAYLAIIYKPLPFRHVPLQLLRKHRIRNLLAARWWCAEIHTCTLIEPFYWSEIGQIPFVILILLNIRARESRPCPGHNIHSQESNHAAESQTAR